MKKLSLLLIVVLMLSAIGINVASADDGICHKEGSTVIYDSFAAYQEGQGGFLTVELWPGHFAVVWGVYHWTEATAGAGYWLFVYDFTYACDPDVIGMTYEESSYVEVGSGTNFEHTEGFSADAVNGGFVANAWQDTHFAEHAWTHQEESQEWTWMFDPID